MWPLSGWRLNDDVVELPIFAVVGKWLVSGPCFTDNIKGLVEPGVGLFHRHAEAGKFIVAVALADTEIEPTTGEEIEGRRLLRQQYRIVPRQHDHRGTQPQPPRA